MSDETKDPKEMPDTPVPVSKTHFCAKTGEPFKLGAKPTPKHRLQAARPFVQTGATLPTLVTLFPAKMDMWGNNQYGDCVSAEEAFNQSVCGKFLSAQTVVNWAYRNGYRDGAMLDEVMASMNRSGMVQDGHTYGVGAAPLSVDYTNEETLKAALAIGVVKIGIDHSALPQGAGNGNGWFGKGGRPNSYTNEDHCISICGYGKIAEMAAKLGVAVPASADPNKVYYALFTWGGIGFVDFAWVLSTVGEAWLRNPGQLIDGVAQPNPGPKPEPTPTPTPVPVPTVALPWYAWAAIGAVGVVAVVALVVALKKK